MPHWSVQHTVSHCVIHMQNMSLIFGIPKSHHQLLDSSQIRIIKSVIILDKQRLFGQNVFICYFHNYIHFVTQKRNCCVSLTFCNLFNLFRRDIIIKKTKEINTKKICMQLTQNLQWSLGSRRNDVTFNTSATLLYSTHIWTMSGINS